MLQRNPACLTYIKLQCSHYAHLWLNKLCTSFFFPLHHLLFIYAHRSQSDIRLNLRISSLPLPYTTLTSTLPVSEHWHFLFLSLSPYFSVHGPCPHWYLSADCSDCCYCYQTILSMPHYSNSLKCSPACAVSMGCHWNAALFRPAHLNKGRICLDLLKMWVVFLYFKPSFLHLMQRVKLCCSPIFPSINVHQHNCSGCIGFVRAQAFSEEKKRKKGKKTLKGIEVKSVIRSGYSTHSLLLLRSISPHRKAACWLLETGFQHSNRAVIHSTVDVRAKPRRCAHGWYCT